MNAQARKYGLLVLALFLVSVMGWWLARGKRSGQGDDGERE